jgi:hypothetical protein
MLPGPATACSDRHNLATPLASPGVGPL